MRIDSLQISEIQKIISTGSGEWWDKDWTTGFFKKPVEGKVWLGYEGLDGDAQSDRKNHGGSDKAICAYCSDHFSYWSKQLINVSGGAFGENLTLSGITERDVRVGDIYELGECLVEVSQPRQPCWKLARRWRIKDLSAQVEKTGFTGFYFRVIRNGFIERGNEFKLIDQGKFSISYCNEIFHHDRKNLEAAKELASYRQLSASWKDSLSNRFRSQ